MYRAPTAVVAALLLALLVGGLAAHAQSIYGLSFRPTEALPEDALRGTVDIVASGTEYVVSVDLGKASGELDLSRYDEASTFVVWAVDMDGESTNIGQLDDALRLEDAPVEFFIAKLYLTAEASGDVAKPTGERLYEVTLRRVTEVDLTAADEEGEEAEEATEAEEAEESEEAPKPTAAAASSQASSTGTTEAKPQVLPTTGSHLGDLLVLAVVAVALITAGLRLRTVRL